MREFLDAILEFIGAESLTDEEWDAIDLDEEELNINTYLALKGVLESREAVSSKLTRLQYYFKAAGLVIGDQPAHDPQSNILIGGPL